MQDYRFGNLIYDLRRKAGYSQKALAQQLGVTDKAVSKWENGRAKPGVEMIRRLSRILNVSADDLLNYAEERPEKKITKIVITGGPCAGKTTAMQWIQNSFTQRGYAVMFVSETATELITGGAAPWTLDSVYDFQRCLFHLQMEKEKTYLEAAQVSQRDKVLIVCDRGAVDNHAYLTDGEFQSLLREAGISEIELKCSYDAVFHLVTAAKGAEGSYTTSNNQARRETPEEARKLDDRLIAAWTGHPHLRILDNSTGFEEKIQRLIAEISLFIGEPEPVEIERKFLIVHPDVEKLEKMPHCRKLEIIQTYLCSENGEESRIRQCGAGGHYAYYQTKKRRLDDLHRVELEERISRDTYLHLLMKGDPAMHPIRKTRYCISYDSQYFELDVYPFWKDRAILEIEVHGPEQEIRFPDFLEILEEVTDKREYTNYELARYWSDI